MSTPTPKPPPDLSIPPSTSTVNIHVINTTSHISKIPTSLFVEPQYKGFAFLDCPAYSFLIEHPPTGRKFLFDLGVRKDWQNYSARIASRIKDEGWTVEVEKGVAEILQEGGVMPGDIEGIIWSHHHWDHTGDPSTFPSSTSLIVGPGFKNAFTPAYPTNPDAPILESDYAGRTLREISFDNDSTLTLGGFRAIDFFGDGSFYLLDAPGHAIGHMCALCRTTPGSHAGEGQEEEQPTFIFLGGDCAHHGGEFRPTEYLPLPSEIIPSPIPKIHPAPCPGALFEKIHRLYPSGSEKARTQPFMLPSATAANDVVQARESVVKMAGFDGHGNVLTVIAHDASLGDVLGVFPGETANLWWERGWRGRGLWGFLGDFEVGGGKE